MSRRRPRVDIADETWSLSKFMRMKRVSPAERCHRVLVKDAAGHVVMELGRNVGRSAGSDELAGDTWFTMSNDKFPTISVLHDGSHPEGYVDKTTRSFSFVCKVCRDRGVLGGYVGDIRFEAIDSVLDAMATKYGTESDTPRTVSIPLVAPDSL